MPAGQSLSLYFHVPFCRSMCWYCGCHTKIVARYEPVAEYLDLLKREIDLIAAALPVGLPVRHIHFGGGTPTMIAPADFEALLAHVRSRFTVEPDCEIAVEIDPRTLAAEAPAALARAGVNRASLGVQDLDPTVQGAINRVQPYAVTEGAVLALRRAGIDSINLDLMYGLPHQTPESCEESAELVMELTPERLSVFGYAHVPWMKKHQRLIDESALADSRGRWKQFDVIAAVLADHGYHQIGLDHFALESDPITVAQRDGTLRRNFQGYTTDGADVLIGFGASSIGAMPNGYVQNDPAIDRYGAAVRAGRLPIVKGKQSERRRPDAPRPDRAPDVRPRRRSRRCRGPSRRQRRAVRPRPGKAGAPGGGRSGEDRRPPHHRSGRRAPAGPRGRGGLRSLPRRGGDAALEGDLIRPLSPSRLVLPSGFLRSFGPKLRECQRDGGCHEREDRAMITLYSYPSPNGHKASIMLEETGLPYETVRVDVTTGENLEPGFLAISPLGKIPALIDHDAANAPRRVFGSGAILEYLGEKTGKFLPTDVCARTEVWNWLAFGVSDVGPTSVDMFRFGVRAPEKLPYAIELFKSELHRCYRALEAQLSQTEYLVDGEYTIADISVFPFIAVASQTAPTLFEKYPSLKRWHDLVSTRPGVQRGMVVPE